jgi:signal transduction histidine kinase
VKDHVFKPFTSGRPSHGVGLCLAICRQLGETLGVTIDLVNTTAPAGLEARVAFPAGSVR